MNYTLFDNPFWNDPEPSHQVEDLFQVWKEVFGPNRAKLTPRRRSVIKKMLKEFTFDQLERALQIAGSQPFWRGKNKWNKKLDDIAILFRTPERIRGFLKDFTEIDLEVSDDFHEGERF